MIVDLPAPKLRSADHPDETPLDFAREWVDFFDPADAERLIRADLTFLLSNWQCVYGSGCQGIISGQAEHGCCSHGAFFTDADDQARVKNAVKSLTRETWQNYVRGFDNWTEWDVVDDENEEQRRTALVDGACIFLNRAGFAGGEGCALHNLAGRAGLHPLELKPDVCWQLPIRREEDWQERPDGTQILVTVLTEFDRRAWGEGGHDLNWWCTSSPSAHTGIEPVYVSYRPELEALIGLAAYEELAKLCKARKDSGMLAPHPAG
ncbi:MAG: hypothetical protein HOQ05_02185 [Corynebacteriales bacterium]|nr:hypothetical protein [Mycobacteriales bacterium]